MKHVFTKLAISTAILSASLSLNASVINIAVLQDTAGTSQVNEVLAQLNDSTVFNFNAVEVLQSNVSSVLDLSSFDALVIGGSGNTTAGWTQNFLSSASSFMALGGGIVTAGWWHFSLQSLGGVSDIAAQAISPALTTGSYNFESSATQTIFDNTHAITMGVSDFGVSGCCIEIPNGTDVGAVALGSANGSNNIMYQDLIGRSVFLGPVYMSAASYDNDQLRSGDADKLFEQAVGWAADASTTPVSEPAPAALLVLGLGCLLASRKRRFKTKHSALTLSV